MHEAFWNRLLETRWSTWAGSCTLRWEVPIGFSTRRSSKTPSTITCRSVAAIADLRGSPGAHGVEPPGHLRGYRQDLHAERAARAAEGIQSEDAAQ
jgi:hypothetical protein